MAGFRKGGFGFCLQRSNKNLDPSEIFFKGADKQSTLRISFFKGHRQKLRVRIPAILIAGGGGGGVRIKNGTSHHFVLLKIYIDICKHLYIVLYNLGVLPRVEAIQVKNTCNRITLD